MLPTFKHFFQYQVLKIRVYFLQVRMNKWFEKTFTCINGPSVALDEYKEFAGMSTVKSIKDYNLVNFEHSIKNYFIAFKQHSLPYKIIIFRVRPEFIIGIDFTFDYHHFSVSFYTRCHIMGLKKEHYINEQIYFSGICNPL